MKRIFLTLFLLLGTVACAEETTAPDPSPATGSLHFHRAFEAEGILPRDVLVWTPAGYEIETGRRYPVVYMHDAQMLFDALTTWNGQEWAVDESVEHLVRDGAIDPVIIVGLANTRTRTEDYSPTPRGEAYMKFLVDSVKPMVDETYRTKPGRAHTLTGGSSMGGLISCMLGWRYPEVFGAVMCFSPAFRVEDNPDWSLFFTDSGEPKRDTFFWIYNGGLELEQKLQPGIDHMLAWWESQGYRPGEDFVFVHDPEAGHNEEAWAKQFPEALKRSLEEAARR